MPKLKKKSECVKVVVRGRPLNKKEIGNKSSEVIFFDRKKNEICIKKPKSNGKQSKCFTYDAVFPPSIS